MNKSLNWFTEQVRQMDAEILAAAEDISMIKGKIQSYRNLQARHEDMNFVEEIEKCKQQLALIEIDFAEAKRVREYYKDALELYKLLAIIKQRIKDPTTPNWLIFFSNDKVKAEFTRKIKDVLYGKE